MTLKVSWQMKEKPKEINENIRAQARRNITKIKAARKVINIVRVVATTKVVVNEGVLTHMTLILRIATMLAIEEGKGTRILIIVGSEATTILKVRL